MPAPCSNKYGAFAIKDSGIQRSTYTTLILFHGVSFNSAIFDKLFPLASKFNVRIVAATRPGYSGSTPLSDEERNALSSITEAANEDPEHASNALLRYIKEEAQKTYDFLVEYISREDISTEGGIILAGWSGGAALILGLLANAQALSTSKAISLPAYIKFMVMYDIPSFMLGYAPPPDIVDPLFDPSLTPDELFKIFPGWVSSYHAHNEDLSKLAYEPLNYPPPTLATMDPSDLQRCLEVGPALPGGPDDRLLQLGVKLGVFARLKDAAIYSSDTGKNKHGWNSVALKNVWCDRSPWEIAWQVTHLQAELEEAKKSGKFLRKIDMVRLRGGNHFCHWDKPELALTGLLPEV